MFLLHWIDNSCKFKNIFDREISALSVKSYQLSIFKNCNVLFSVFKFVKLKSVNC